MSVNLSPNLPANVVEIGNEISQAKIDEINAGTLALQTWVSASYLTTASASSTYAPKASPTFTGTVTIPAGASISGYLTTSSAASTYQTQAGMSSYLTTSSASSTYQTQAGMSSYLTTASASSTYAPKANPTFSGTVTIPAGANIIGYATISYVGNQGFITDAPSDGSEYVRKNAAWAVSTGGGGSVAWGGITGTVTDQTDLTTYISGLGYQTASDVSTYATANFYPLSTNPSGYLSSIPAKTLTTYTTSANFSSSDVGNVAYLSSGGMGFGMTIPDDSTVSWSNGNEITVVVDSLSSYTISGGMGVSVNNTSTITLTSYVTTLVKVAANTWYIS